MSDFSENVEAQALKLPRGERAQIALRLLDSLEQGESSASKNAIERAWVAESVRRLEAYQRGDMASQPVEEVITELESSDG